MGNKLSMARSEDTRQPELLDEGESGVSSLTPSRRNKREKAAPAKQKGKGGKAKDTKTAGKVSAEAEGTNGDSSQPSKRGRHKQSDKDRKPDRGVEGEDRAPRRNSSELGIEWVGSSCPDRKPHYFVASFNLDGGNVFKCKNCKKHIWLPATITEATILDHLIDFIGTTAGYRKYLDKHREAKVMVAKLQDLWYARQKISDNGDFMKLVLSVMEDKEYDRKEVE